MKQDISKIDPNFLSSSAMTSDYVWYDIEEEPIEVRGLAVHEGDVYSRLPLSVAENTNEGVAVLTYHTAGGHIRFRTDSKKIAIRVCSRYANMMSHMPLTGSAGVDVYLNGRFASSVRPAGNKEGWYENVCLNPFGMSCVEINLPLYNGLTHMLVGILPDSKIEAPMPYTMDVPIVYYGSSITQGGCASRPGNSYQGFLSRWLDADQINLGFSGSARGEQIMAEYIASLNMSAFVYDYDHNAPSIEHLRKTHEPFFRTIRKAHPDLPILMISRPDTDATVYSTMEDNYCGKCSEIIYTTYQHAKDEGDDKVWFLDGATLFGGADRDSCTIDGAHPNDFGFHRMAETIYPILKEMLNL